jgi:hypothetical protein
MRQSGAAILAAFVGVAMAVIGRQPALAASTCSATDTSDGFTSADLQAAIPRRTACVLPASRQGLS